MKFTIQKKPLARMLRALTQQTGRKRGERDSHLRLSAQGSQITMCANDTEAGYEATVFEDGVCFFVQPISATCSFIRGCKESHDRSNG